MKKLYKTFLTYLGQKLCGTIVPPEIKLNQTGPAGYTVEPKKPLSFNEWAKYTKVSSRDSERAIRALVEQDEYYIYQKMYKDIKTNEIDSKISAASIAEFILGKDRTPIQL